MVWLDWKISRSADAAHFRVQTDSSGKASHQHQWRRTVQGTDDHGGCEGLQCGSNCSYLLATGNAACGAMPLRARPTREESPTCPRPSSMHAANAAATDREPAEHPCVPTVSVDQINPSNGRGRPLAANRSATWLRQTLDREISGINAG